MKVVSASGTLKIGGVAIKWTPVGPKTDKYGIFYEKNRFLPDANQKSESAVGGGGGGGTVPRGSKRISKLNLACPK